MRAAIDICRTDLPFPAQAWCATLDSYDGAPDGDNLIGFGATEALAVEALIELIEDAQ